MMAFLNEGLEIRFVDERADHEQQVTFKYSGGIQDFVRHLNRRRRRSSRRSPTSSRPRPTMRSSSRSSGTPASTRASTLRQRHRHERGRHARGGLQEGPHQRGQQVRTRQGACSRRRRTTSSAKTSARGSPRSSPCKLREPQFEGQTKAKLGNVVHAVARREGHEREARPSGWRSTRPRRSQIVQKSLNAARARVGGAPGARPHPSQVSARGRGHARQARRTATRVTRARASCSSSRATRPAARPSRPATRRRRRSCRSAARSSTSSGPASTRC